jgi:hypothetical protein
VDQRRGGADGEAAGGKEAAALGLGEKGDPAWERRGRVCVSYFL